MKRMETDYNNIAKEYQASKMQPWRHYVEGYTLFQLVGDLSGKTVLDLACGDGFYTRQLKMRGAEHVEGVDISAGMIKLAKELEASKPLNITYHTQDVKLLDMGKKFDLITASYLLNYASSANDLRQFANVISSHLKTGGRFVCINSNPDYRSHNDAMRKYGFTRSCENYTEGEEVVYRFYQADGSFIEVVNYHLEKNTHNYALEAAGLAGVQWQDLQLSPSALPANSMGYWNEILNSLPVIGISCIKSQH